ncbi:MAG TPA: YceI family protein [Flavisolibacter sp.]|nr:YceI family protein [Flavisolibacter sp.]
MRSFIKTPYLIIALFISSMGYIVSCTHDDEILSLAGPKIERGTDVLSLNDSKVSFDKTHSNVGWETMYLGGLSLLTGRFDTLGFTSFNFDEANPANTNFEAWVWINKVNTSEPGRDKGCLQTTFNVTPDMGNVAANIAKIKTTKVTLSTTDKGYIVDFDLTFHGVTKSLTGKFYYSGKTVTGTGAAAKSIYGFSFDFQFLAKTDFAIISNNIADKITVKCNGIFRQTQ